MALSGGCGPHVIYSSFTKPIRLGGPYHGPVYVVDPNTHKETLSSNNLDLPPGGYWVPQATTKPTR